MCFHDNWIGAVRGHAGEHPFGEGFPAHKDGLVAGGINSHHGEHAHEAGAVRADGIEPEFFDKLSVARGIDFVDHRGCLSS